jgi:sporulation protein YlmC with PRC-barrel domain
MRISEIFGKGVLDKNANNVGKVIDADINLSPWEIKHFIVKIGIAKKLPISVEKVDKCGDKVILNVTKEELGV